MIGVILDYIVCESDIRKTKNCRSIFQMTLAAYNLSYVK